MTPLTHRHTAGPTERYQPQQKSLSGGTIKAPLISLAANRLVGPNFSREVVGRMTSAENASARREHLSPLQHQRGRSEEPVGNPVDKKGKESEKKKED